jgi:membrane-bound lytic murein transglycosylase B
MDRRELLKMLGSSTAGMLVSGVMPKFSEAAPANKAYTTADVALELKILQAELNLTLRDYYKDTSYDVAPYFEDSRFKIYQPVINWTRQAAAARERRKKEKKQRTVEEKRAYYQNAYQSHKKRKGVPALKIIAQDFYREHKGFLEMIEHTMLVDKRYIAAVLAIETRGVTYFGDYDPFNALVSLNFTNRKAELTDTHLPNLIILAEKRGENPHNYPSSYTGAITGSQMEPKVALTTFKSIDSLRKARPDFYNPQDCIVSTALYLQPYWDINHADSHPENDFCVLTDAIMAYNPSMLYAMAVTEIAKSIKV